MGTYQRLKSMWKKLGIKGEIRNYSSKPLWVLETGSGKTVAHLLPPMTKTPTNIDADAFKRVDGKPISGHKHWWKILDISTVEIFDSRNDLKVSVIKKIKIDESSDEFGKEPVIYDNSKNWGLPLKLVTDVKRNKKKRITKYYVTEVGWLTPDQALEMTCAGEIVNARPVFPSTGRPYIRTRRDRELFNNLEVKG